MKNSSGSSNKGPYDKVGKNGKIHENSQSDFKSAEVTLDIVPVQESLNIHAEASAKEVVSDQVCIVENSSGVTSADSGYVQLADSSSTLSYCRCFR